MVTLKAHILPHPDLQPPGCRGSLMAGNRAAQIMSLLETAKRNGLEPHAWLTDVLTRLPEWPEDRLAELLPLEGFTFSG